MTPRVRTRQTDFLKDVLTRIREICDNEEGRNMADPKALGRILHRTPKE